MSTEKLHNAFLKREGRIDHESFMWVVSAFFSEVQNNSVFTLPYHIVNGQYQPFLLSSDDSCLLLVVSDPVYMNDFPDHTHVGMKAHDMLDLVKKSEKITGILINPFSESHCYLPKADILGYMDSIGMTY